MPKGNKLGSGVKRRAAPYDHIKLIVVKQLASEFKYTPEYIRKCLRGDSKALVVDDINKRYVAIYQQLENALEVSKTI